MLHPEIINAPLDRLTLRCGTWSDPDAVRLRRELSSELSLRYADREAIPGHLPTGMFVTEDTVVGVVLAYDVEVPVGHATIRRLGDDLELKNMYVSPSWRGTGLASLLLLEAERIAATVGGVRLILQTGDRQPEAERLYERAGYCRIPIFPPYENLTYSRCFAKTFGSAASTV